MGARRIAADVVRFEDSLLAEHWDVLQDEATEAQSVGACRCSATGFPTPFERYETRGPDASGQERQPVGQGSARRAHPLDERMAITGIACFRG